jgi:two-component system sensor histidine kinase/response regulator
VFSEVPHGPGAKVPAELPLLDPNSGYLVTQMRVGASLVIAFQLACLLAGPYQARPAAPGTALLHLLNMLLGVAILGATSTNIVKTHWRSVVWFSCCALMVSTTLIGLADKRPALMFGSVLLLLIGSGVLIPWGWRWQAAVEIVGIVCLIVASLTIPLTAYFWIILGSAVALAHLTHEVGRRNRLRIKQALQSQVGIQAALRNKIAELERAERHAQATEDVARRIIAASPDVITINRLSDGSYVHLNREFESTGFRAAQTVGRSPQQISIWADTAKMLEFVETLKARKRVRNFAADFRRFDGVVVPCLISGVVMELDGEPCIVSFTRDVSSIKETERKLQENEEMLRKIIETTPDVITINRQSDRAYVTVNSGFTQTTGFTSEEALGKSPAALGIWADPKQARAFVDRLSSESIVRNMEVDVRHKDGRIIPHLLSAVVTEIGGEVCLVSIGRDIHSMRETELELRDAQQELSRSEQYYRTLIDCSSDLILVLDQAGTIIFTGGEGRKNLGYEVGETIGTNAFEHVHPENLAQQAELTRLAFQEPGSVMRSEARIQHKDGSWIACEFLGRATIDPDGKPILVTTMREITQRKLAEAELARARDQLSQQVEALRASEDRLRAEAVKREQVIADRELTAAQLRESQHALRQLFDQNLDSLMILDLETGRYTDVNEEYTRHSGYSREEIVGKRSREVNSFLNPEDTDRLVAELKRVGVVRNMEATFIRKDGSTYSGLISALNLKLRGRWCCITFTRDIGALKETQDQLIAAREAALEASRAKSDFLSSMSHEIRTPMNAVLGMAELLAGSPLADEQRRWVNVMRSNGDALLDLINDILDLAKIESGRLTIERVALDLEELIDKLGDMMGARAHEKGLEFAMRIAPDVPHNLLGDPLRLRQILVNLLGNAVKFTDHGQVVLSVERADIDTAGRPDPDQIGLRFAIRDTGIGIPKDKLSIIFSSFGQADSSTTRRYGGSGLGLAIARRLVELSGGEISVESEPGVGSCFSFVAKFGVGQALAKRGGAVHLNLRDVETLIVDDTEVNRLILREILESEGARVIGAPSGVVALEELKKATAARRRFGLILLDCRMPGMDGIELAARIREFYANSSAPLPVVMMLTSDEMNIRLPQLCELGLRAYLVKPIRRTELLEAISKAMSDAEAGAESSASPLAAEVTGTLSGLQILLADDSPDNRLLVRAFLAKTGCLLNEVADGREALARYTTGNYDLVLMDIRMPVMDGLAATRAIRQWENENRRLRTPIIALTASALPDAVRECLDAGCDAHVSKPVKRATLIDAIRAARPSDVLVGSRATLLQPMTQSR